MERKVMRSIFGTFACLLVVGLAVSPVWAQDDCATAVTAPWNTFLSGGTLGVNLDPCADATPTYVAMSGCSNGGGTKDQWAKFVAMEGSARLRTDIGSVGTDSTFNVKSGACPGSNIACSADEVVPPYLGDITVGGLTIGNTYHVQMGTWADGCPNGPYQLTVQGVPPLPTLPEWGLLGLGVLLLGGGAVVFGRLRVAA